MKRLILILILTILPAALNEATAAETPKIINLHTDGAYVFELDARPIELQVTNPRIMKAEVITDLYDESSEIVIRTYEEGISYVTYKLHNVPKTVKVLIDDKANEDEGLTRIDKVKELEN